MTDEKQDPSVVLNNVIGWLAELDYPGVGTQMQRLSSLTSDLTAMKAELEEAKKERGEKQPAAAGLVELDGVTMTPAAAANRLRAAEQERDELREALNLAAINRATEPSNGGTA